MAKLTQTQKELAAMAAEMLHDCRVRVFFSRESRIMIGIQAHNFDVKNPNTWRVFITQCHQMDDFKKKLGLIELCKKFENDQFVLYRGGNDLELIADNFIYFFGQDDWAGDVQEIDLADMIW